MDVAAAAVQPTIRRVYRGKKPRTLCLRRVCLRRHWRLADCPCGWTSTYVNRWAAERMLDFHLDDHGGADD